MSDYTSPDELNDTADSIAARMATVGFLSAGVETAIPREALTFTAAGLAGATDAQVALDGRAWSQMLTVTIPDGVTVDGLALYDSTGTLRRSRDIPPRTGPYTWTFAVPIEPRN